MVSPQGSVTRLHAGALQPADAAQAATSRCSAARATSRSTARRALALDAAFDYPPGGSLPRYTQPCVANACDGHVFVAPSATGHTERRDASESRRSSQNGAAVAPGGVRNGAGCRQPSPPADGSGGSGTEAVVATGRATAGHYLSDNERAAALSAAALTATSFAGEEQMIAIERVRQLGGYPPCG